jgi:hypothetical protein
MKQLRIPSNRQRMKQLRIHSNRQPQVWWRRLWYHLPEHPRRQYCEHPRRQYCQNPGDADLLRANGSIGSLLGFGAKLLC